MKVFLIILFSVMFSIFSFALVVSFYEEQKNPCVKGHYITVLLYNAATKTSLPNRAWVCDQRTY